jgi:hypothetical protein
MPFHMPLLAALILFQGSGPVPQEAKGLQILWVPMAVAETSNTTPGFKFRHPITYAELSFTKAKELKTILEVLPTPMKENGIWISTTNSFLYSKEENLELKTLVAMAKAQKIVVFLCELPKQPEGWKKVEG